MSRGAALARLARDAARLGRGASSSSRRRAPRRRRRPRRVVEGRRPPGRDHRQLRQLHVQPVAVPRRPRVRARRVQERREDRRGDRGDEPQGRDGVPGAGTARGQRHLARGVRKIRPRVWRLRRVHGASVHRTGVRRDRRPRAVRAHAREELPGVAHGGGGAAAARAAEPVRGGAVSLARDLPGGLSGGRVRGHGVDEGSDDHGGEAQEVSEDPGRAVSPGEHHHGERAAHHSELGEPHRRVSLGFFSSEAKSSNVS
mmetsp:Transcript_4432/g.15672  ORF Transcript_4432/g.15672 Transcript_4432/m.15672 type:complete len:257 (-) Transcript_4432:7-777(-)